MKIVTVGNTVFEIVTRGDALLATQPGGSAMNLSVSLARSNVDVHFYTSFGDDLLGHTIRQFFVQNGISTEYAVIQGQTNVTVGKLNGSEATYEKFKTVQDYPVFDFSRSIGADLIMITGSYVIQGPKALLDNILAFSSKYAIPIYFDPNPRSPLQNTHFNTLLDHCMYFRVSEDDLKYIPDFHLQNGAVFIQTNPNQVTAKQNQIQTTVLCPKITPVCTIGAGDAFNAGFCSAEGTFEERIKNGVDYAQRVCMKFEPFI
ncbi:Fructokinase [Hexamita inflata]|uniref:Fructokinase n=1 Tax=Hexamita inflata TaxID=28002 RepID=A0AA86V1A3_9EUKA|nr:Fructokinase [Hexamita inflata]